MTYWRISDRLNHFWKYYILWSLAWYSTPSGITAIISQLTAFCWSCETVLNAFRHHSNYQNLTSLVCGDFGDVLNAFRHHSNYQETKTFFLFVTLSCAQRLPASQQLSGEFFAVVFQIHMCSTPSGITAIISIVFEIIIRRFRKCSTPSGITAIISLINGLSVRWL